MKAGSATKTDAPSFTFAKKHIKAIDSVVSVHEREKSAIWHWFYVALHQKMR